MISSMQMLNKEWIIEDMIRMVVLKQVSLKKSPRITAITIRATLEKMQLIKARNHHHIKFYLMNKWKGS